MNFINYSKALFCILYVLIDNTYGMHEGQYDNQGLNSYINSEYLDDDPSLSFLYNRNARQGRYSQNQGVRFGWQNPIRVAPTLRPPNSYPATEAPAYFQPTRPPTTTTGYPGDPWITSGSNQNGQYVQPPRGGMMPNAQPQTGRKCSKESRKDKQTGTCVRLGSTCGENMAFYEDPTDKEFGECDCIQNANRPLVYHPETGKCYFAFQTAFCNPNQWLIVDRLRSTHPYHRCATNPCRDFATQVKQSNWNWQSNDMALLNRDGPVALFNERQCSILGSSCSQPGNEQLTSIILPTFDPSTRVVLAFQGSDLACRRVEEINEIQQRNFALACKPGLINKWRLEGRCGASSIDTRKK